MRLKNKVIIITGSSIGIGKAMAYEMCKEGAKVVLNARNPTRLDKTFQKMKAEGHEVAAIAGDVSNMEDCQKIVDHTVQVFGQIDAVVNNAGISMEGSFELKRATQYRARRLTVGALEGESMGHAECTRWTWSVFIAFSV